MKKLIYFLLLVFLLVLSGLTASCTCTPWYYNSMPHMGFTVFPLLWFPFGLISLGIYFLPTIIAAVRHKQQIAGIVLLNVLGGWTFIGWVIALIWALSGK